MNDRIIEHVMQLDYLETRITSNKRTDEKIENQWMKAKRIAGSMNNLIWSNKYLKKEPKIRV